MLTKFVELSYRQHNCGIDFKICIIVICLSLALSIILLSILGITVFAVSCISNTISLILCVDKICNISFYGSICCYL